MKSLPVIFRQIYDIIVNKRYSEMLVSLASLLTIQKVDNTGYMTVTFVL